MNGTDEKRALNPFERVFAAMFRLFELGDGESLDRVLAAAEAFVAVHDAPDESHVQFMARLDRVFGGRRPDPPPQKPRFVIIDGGAA